MGANQEVQKNRKIKLRGKVERDHMTEEIFCLLLRQGQKQDKKLEVQVFLVHLLIPLSFASLPCFRLMLANSAHGMAIGLAISATEFIGGEVIIDFSGWSQ